jgi:hypothetical protein
MAAGINNLLHLRLQLLAQGVNSLDMVSQQVEPSQLKGKALCGEQQLMSGIRSVPC